MRHDLFDVLRRAPDISIRGALEEFSKRDPLIWALYYRRLRGRPLLFDVAKDIGDPMLADGEYFRDNLSAEDREKKALLIRHRPFLIQPLVDMHPHKAYQKGRQIGVSENSITEAICFLHTQEGTKLIYCVPKEAEILTKRGWLRYSELTRGDIALVLDPETRMSKWEPVLEVNMFHYDGVLKAVGPFHCTDEHRWPVIDRNNDRMKIVTTNTLRRHLHKITRLAPHENTVTNSILSPRLAAILGWVVTDGHQYMTGSPGKKNTTMMLVTQSKKKHLEEIEKLLGMPRQATTYTDLPTIELGGRGGRVVGYTSGGSRIYGDTYTVRVNRRDIEALKSAGYRSKEDLPWIVTQLSEEALLAMFDAMFKAEGSYSGRGRKSRCFAQNPGPVLDAFQIICTLLGKYANTFESKSGCGGAYIVEPDSPYAYLKPTPNWRKVTDRQYKGVVWCPRTPSGTWFMRYNGHVVFTGNSFPRDKQLVDFSTTRLAEALNESPRMRKLFGVPNQVYTKRIGKNSFMFLRSAWESNLGEGIDADAVVFDEKDRMQDGIEVAFEESLSASKWHLRRDVSTPTLPGRGVNLTYDKSCQFEWHVKCVKCGTEQTVRYPDNVIQMMDIPLGTTELPAGAYAYRCRRDKCRGPLDRLHGRWIPRYPERNLIHGYLIPQTIAPWISATEVMQKLIKYRFKSLWSNYVLGETAVGENMLLTDSDFENSMAGHSMVSMRTVDWERVTVGVDWGYLNWVIVLGQNAHNGKKYILNIAVFEDTDDPFQSARDVASFIAPYEPEIIVPDAGYGKDRNSYLLKKFPNRVFSCYYNPNEANSRTFEPVWSEALSKVLVDRTMSLKNMCRAIRDREIGFPEWDHKVSLLVKHLKALAPMKEEVEGEIVETIGKTSEDHLSHALCYSLIGFEKLTKNSSFSADFV